MTGLYDDPDYTKYNTFIHTTVPAMGAEIRKLMGDNASDSQIQQIENLVNPANWTGTADQIKSRWNELKEVERITSEQMMKNPLDIQADTQRVPRVPRGTKSATKTQYTPDQQKKAAEILKKRGIY